MKRLALTLSLVCALNGFSCRQSFGNCAAASNAASAVESSLYGKCDWVMEVSVRELPRYLNHPGTKLGRMSRVHLTVRSLSNRQYSLATHDYEELYYSDGTVIGSRSLQQLNLPHGSIGAIVVVDTGDYLNSIAASSAAANALTRAYVDIAMKDAVTLSVICPAHAIDSIESSMTSLNFVLITNSMDSCKSSSSMNLHFRNDANDEEQTLVFFPPDKN